MKWYGINISKFCGITVSSDTPIVKDEPLFLAHIQEVRKAFTVLSNRYITEQFNLKPIKNNRAFEVSVSTANKVDYKAVFSKNNREFRVIQG